ncbi:hypothetical protein WL15_20370 [Burkholderia multivorans]|nr:hypothetical protein WL15_20370 [Burkholderia multivorans]
MQFAVPAVEIGQHDRPELELAIAGRLQCFAMSSPAAFTTSALLDGLMSAARSFVSRTFD